jgi:hypothetical protein
MMMENYRLTSGQLTQLMKRLEFLLSELTNMMHTIGQRASNTAESFRRFSDIYGHSGVDRGTILKLNYIIWVMPCAALCSYFITK